MHISYQNLLVALFVSSAPNQVFSSAILEARPTQLPCPDTSPPTTHLNEPQSRPWIDPRAFIFPPRVVPSEPIILGILDPIDPIVPSDSTDPTTSAPIGSDPDTPQDPQDPEGIFLTEQPTPTATPKVTGSSAGTPKPSATGDKEDPDLPDGGGSSSTTFVIGPSATSTSGIARSNGTDSSGQGGADPEQLNSSASSWHQGQGILHWLLLVSVVLGVLSR